MVLTRRTYFAFALFLWAVLPIYASHHLLVDTGHWKDLHDEISSTKKICDQWSVFNESNDGYKVSLIQYIEEKRPQEDDNENYDLYLGLKGKYETLLLFNEFCQDSPHEKDSIDSSCTISITPTDTPTESLVSSNSTSPRHLRLSSASGSGKNSRGSPQKSLRRRNHRPLNGRSMSADLPHAPRLSSSDGYDWSALLSHREEAPSKVENTKMSIEINALSSSSRKKYITITNLSPGIDLTLWLDKKNSVGSGEQGTVYKVERRDGSLAVKVSVANPEPHTKLDFETEYMALRRLGEDPYVCFFSAWEKEGDAENEYCYLIKDFAEGKSFFSWRYSRTDKTFSRRNLKFSKEKLVLISMDAMMALNFLHSKNLIHRDIKPENMILDGDELAVKIIDLGRTCDSSRGGRVFVGSKGYKGPERTFDNPCLPETIASDDWGLAVVLLEFLSKVGNWRQYVEDRPKFEDIFMQKHLAEIFSDITASIAYLDGEITTVKEIGLKLRNNRASKENDEYRESLIASKAEIEQTLNKPYNILLLALRDFTLDDVRARPSLEEKEELVIKLAKAIKNDSKCSRREKSSRKSSPREEYRKTPSPREFTDSAPTARVSNMPVEKKKSGLRGFFGS